MAITLHLLAIVIGIVRELRRAARSLAATPALTAAAIVTLGLGCGAAIAIGTIVDGLLFRPLPAVGNRDALLVYPTVSGALDADSDALDLNEVEALRASNAVAEVGTLLVRNLTLTAGEPERVAGASISPNFLDLLEVRPTVGRTFRADDAAPWGQEQVALLAHGLWLRRFAGDPNVVGKSIEVNQRTLTVIGVLPPRFGLPNAQQIYLPWRSDPEWERDERDFWVVATLAPGAQRAAAQSAANLVAERLIANGTIAERERGFRLMPLRDAIYDPHAGKMMALLSLLVVALLGVACFNVANLLLARNAARDGELAVRLALGASRARVLAENLIESLLVATSGALLGLALGAWGLERIVAALDDLPSWIELRVDGRIALGTVALGFVVALVAGLLPALRAGRTDVVARLVAVGRTAVSPARRPLERLLVALQLAAALLVMAAASWLVASERAIARANPGFDPSRLLSFRLYLPGDAYDPLAAKNRFQTDLLARLEALPGVAAAAITGQLPADDGGDEERAVPEGVAPSPESSTPMLAIGATRTLFDALGAPLLAGSAWSRAEDEGAPGNSAIVNRALAERLWPGESPLGKRLRLGLDPAATPFEIVGLAPDLVYEEIQEQSTRSRFQLFVPLARYSWRTLAAIVRAADPADPAALAAPARRALAELEPDAPLFDVATYPQRLRRTYQDRTLVGRLAAIFGATGLVLAAVGVFGLLAHALAQRRRELGVRMALGAAPARLVRGIVRDGLLLALPGVGLGLAAAWAIAHALAGFLFGVDPTEPLRFLGVTALVLGGVALASALAARRIVEIDPLDALRSE